MNDVEFVNAGAGSGKTYRLTHILAEALETGSARPHAVMATTFTVKAATELRERARAWLLDNGRLDLATAVGQARLGTVNSVCGQLLKRFCFELGLSPDQTVLSEGQTKKLLATSLADTLDGPGQTELASLTHKFGIDHAEWASAIGKVVKAARDNDVSPDELRQMGARNANLMLVHWPAPAAGTNPTARLATALAAAETSVSGALSALVASNGNVTKVMQDGLHDLQNLSRLFTSGRWTWPDWIAACNIDAGAKMRPVAQPVVQAAQAHEAHPQFHAEVRRYLDLIFSLAADTLDSYAQAKLVLGALDFSDQEVLLLRGLRSNPEVREALASELDLVMVDEFQDTSPLQLALFVELAKLADRSVWIGDPKQAIYGFRGTDASLVKAILTDIEKWGGKLGEPLTTSRRSTPALVSLTNAVFESAFAPDMAADEVRLNPSRQDIPEQPALFNWNFESSRNETDYLGLGSALRDLLNSGLQVEDKVTKKLRPATPGDVAVLCRKHDQVDWAVASLATWGIPSSSPRPGLLGTPEVLFVLACLRRLHDSCDTVASALILSLADGVPASEWLTDRLDYVAKGEAAHLWKAEGEDAHPLLARLEALRPSLLALTPFEALRLAKAQSHVARMASQWSSSPQEARTRIANVEALLEFGQAYEDECISAKRPATVGGLLRWLATMASSGEDSRAATQEDAVSVLTHHGAKGLEWPVVVLTSLGSESRSSLWDVRARTDGQFDPQRPLENRFVHYWLRTWGRRKQPQSAVNAEGSPIGVALAKEALDENKRLLYVSMTRSRDATVLVSCLRPKPNRKWVDEVAATPLLFGDSGELVLPDGQTVRRESRTWTAAECALQPIAPPAIPCHWFIPAPALQARPLWFRPSAAKGGSFALVEAEDVGVRIAIGAKVDMAVLGTALHLCIARAGVVGAAQLSDIERLLERWEVASIVDKQAVQRQIEAFLGWVAKRWPGRTVYVEVPLEADRPDGTRVSGRIDFLVDTPDGWVVLDHKANPRGTAYDDELVQHHGPQLAAYTESLVRATGRPVKEQWLYLPIAARVLRLESEQVCA